jgi:large subunit ribosomal protein LP2
MKHLAAYLLLSLGNKSSPSAKDVKSVLESVGIEADDERLSTLISELKGKDLQEVYRIRAHNTTFGRLTLDS